MLLATVEGALIMCRAERSLTPMEISCGALADMLEPLAKKRRTPVRRVR